MDWTVRDFNQEQDLTKTSEVLAEAFSGYPFFTHVFPRDTVRKKNLPDYFKVFLKYFNRYGKILVEAEARGVALWLMAPETISEKEFNGFLSDNEFWDILLQGEAGYGVLRRWRSLMAVDEVLHEEVMGDQKHCYLAIVGVAPEWQKQGLGQALVQDVLRMSPDLPSYLETHSPSAKEAWEHMGFQVQGYTERDGCYIWGMVRQAD